MPASSPRIAVVGSGVAGLTASYVASRAAEVTLFEADDRLGGHADTHRVIERRPDGDHTLSIDTGFIVHNPRTYPVLLRMFAELDVATQPSEMSMSIRDDDSGLEWAGALGRRGIFPTSANLRNPRYLAMLPEIPRFHRRAKHLLRDTSAPSGHGGDVTLRVFLAQGRFSGYFVRHFMEPMVAAVWSCDPEVALDYPARYLFTFLEHHGMLGIFGSPQWRTVTGGSRAYVDKVAHALAASGGTVVTGTKVTSVLETPQGVEITDGNGGVQHFDAAVIATHPGQALALLAEPTHTQRDALAAMPYEPNTAILHTDTSLMPHAANAWASWNFLRRSEVSPGGSSGVTVTYDLTRLQRLETDTHYFVTLGGEDLIDPAAVIERMEYEHPLYNPTSVAAQRRLPQINTARIAFAGAYHGWGFHEDGARSGLAAVEHLGLTWPTAEQREPLDVPTPGTFRTTIRHTRRRPFKRSFEHRSVIHLVDVDDLPDHGVLGRFEARDHIGDPERTIRENLEAFLEVHDIDVRGGRMFLAANARALGYCFNPISVFWCWDRAGSPAATVVEVHNTYGDRHAYLIDADELGRGTVAKAMYVSPFHGTDGTYRLTAPVPDDTLTIGVNLQTDDGARFSASLSGHRAHLSPRRSAAAAIRHSLLIRMHGIWLWLRRLPIQPRPAHDQEVSR